MNIHTLIKSGIPLASDEGADMIIIMEDETGDLVAYVGKEGDYEEIDRSETDDDDEADLGDLCDNAQAFLDELINVGGDVIEGEAEEA